MTLPVSGAISLGDVNVELQRSATATISMDDAELRTLFAVPSGAIGLASGFGKANKFAISITSNQTNLDLRPWLVSQGWNETSKVELTINAGVWLSSNSTSIAGLRISGSFPNGLFITNNGYIVGMGGAGTGYNTYSGAAGGAGGDGLSTSSALTLTNNGTIAGGGGGGGGGGATHNHSFYLRPQGVYSPGGPGGGGRSGLTNSYSAVNAGTSSGAGAGAGTNSTRALVTYDYNQYQTTIIGGAGGSGGNWGASGAGGAGGYWSTRGQSSGPTPYGGGSGGAAGRAVAGNGYITWVTTGSIYGALV